MYLEHFGLTEPPFSLTPDTNFWFEYTSHHEALNVLTLALRSGEGFIKVTGEVGLGKTLICRKMLNSLGSEYVTAYIPNPHLSPASMRVALAEELGLDASEAVTQEQLLRLITYKLLELAKEGKHVVLALDEALRARSVLDVMEERLCLDTTGVLAFGHGTGGRAVDRLPCVLDVKAAATSSHRPEMADRACEPREAVPYLHIAPLEDRYDPIDGGADCGSEKVSLADLEQGWRARNGCEGRGRKTKHAGGVCTKWDCEEAFVSCHAAGGHRWPGQSRRPADIQNCDGGAMKLPIAEIVWEFFDSFLVERSHSP